jgi:hypothetical protein
MRTAMLTYVVTLTVGQFHDYCRAHRLNPAACRFVARAHVLRGVDLTAHRLVFWGDWRSHPDATELAALSHISLAA